MRSTGFLESEIEVEMEFREALLEYYARYPSGRPEASSETTESEGE